MSLNVEVHDGVSPEVRDIWLSLMPEDHWGFFSHPDWCQAIWNHFGATRARHVLVARDGGRAVGLLPVWTRRMNRFGLFLPVAELFGSRRGDYGGPLLHPGADPRTVLGALMEAAMNLRGTGGTVIWPHMPNTRDLPDLLEDNLRTRAADYVKLESVCHIIEITGDYEEIAAEWDRKQRQNINRYRRKLERDVGPLELVTFDTAERAEAELPSFFEMHDYRWVKDGSPGTFTDPSQRAFFRELTRRFGDDHLYFSALRAGDRTVAYRIGFVYGNHFMAYRSAWDWESRRCSPGQVMNAVTVEDAVERGWAGIDLLGGDYDYKDRLSSRTRGRVTYLVRTGSVAPAYWWLTRGRPIAERFVGGTVHRLRSRWTQVKQGLAELGSGSDDGNGST